jgi:hypothetical protein
MNTRSLRLAAILMAVLSIAMSIAPVEGKDVAEIRRLGKFTIALWPVAASNRGYQVIFEHYHLTR